MARYVPQPVPNLIEEGVMQAFLRAELARISAAVNAKTDRAYGGLFQDPGTYSTAALTSTFVLFDPFDVTIPEMPDGTELDLVAASVSVLTGGAFELHFSTTVINIGNNEEWGFLLYKNGVTTGRGADVVPSNQTEIATVGFDILLNLNRGDALTIRINSVTNNAADVEGSSFIVSRVSESTD